MLWNRRAERSRSRRGGTALTYGVHGGGFPADRGKEAAVPYGAAAHLRGRQSSGYENESRSNTHSTSDESHPADNTTSSSVESSHQRRVKSCHALPSDTPATPAAESPNR